MIYWLSIPIPVPTLGMVAWWLVIGCVVLVGTDVVYAMHKARKGRCPDPVLLGHVAILIVWPLPLYLWTSRIIREARR